MNKFFILVVLSASAALANAQTTPATQPFGKVDMADLQMKECDFEKDANAEVLFDKQTVYFDQQYEVEIEHHKRIKIFNDNGKNEANIRLEFYGSIRYESIRSVQAETINLTNGAQEITKLDKKQIFTERVDNEISAIVFSLPNVKAGSIIEFKYTQENINPGDFPDWYFQSNLPTRYSEVSCSIPSILHYKNLVKVTQPMVKSERNSDGIFTDIALANIPSINDEVYMNSRIDNLQSILYQVISVTIPGRNVITFSDTWNKVGENEIGYDDFGGQFNRKLAGEDVILAKAKTLTSVDDKIAYIFNEVKNSMKWDDAYRRYTNDGTAEAWQKKAGNSTEINLILYHLLTKAGVKAYPMLLSTSKHGKVNPAYPSNFQFNTSATYIPVDSANYYLLDATSKYNFYRDAPENLLNGYGLMIDKSNKKYDLVFIQKNDLARNVIIVNADIKPDGKMDGVAQINNFSYNRLGCVRNYKENGEKKYIDYLKGGDNNLKISSIKFDNMEVDTLPLTQNIAFNLDLAGSDENYIYFKPNIFTLIGANPFLKEKRFTDIDFRYRNNIIIVGQYKLPTGYKSDALPKNVSMVMPDQSISFKRIVGEADGMVVIRYVITYNKSIFFKEDYDGIRDFYKKMYEMLDEQIILKKA